LNPGRFDRPAVADLPPQPASTKVPVVTNSATAKAAVPVRVHLLMVFLSLSLRDTKEVAWQAHLGAR
jgi:hypothetical protein